MVMGSRKVQLVAIALAAIATGTSLEAAERGVSRKSAAAPGADTVVDLLLQVDVLQTELRELRNQVEMQNKALERLESRQKDLLQDLDERVRALEHGSGAAPRGKAGKRAAAGRRPAPASRAQEQQEYDAAFNLMKQGFYDRAVKAFRNFIASYPDSSLVGNAQYWIAEANYVVRNFKKALEEFNKVVKEHPKSAKVPDALLKIGYTHYELEQWDQARASLNDVVKRYPNTRVAKSAERRLRTMKQEGR